MSENISEFIAQADTAALEKRVSQLGLPLNDEGKALAEALMSAGKDSSVLREFYCNYFKALHPECRNFKGVLRSIGITAQNISVQSCLQRLHLYGLLHPGVYCYEPSIGAGRIRALNDSECSIELLQLPSESYRSLQLDFFLSNYFIVVSGTPLEKIFSGDKDIHFKTRCEFDQMCASSFVSLKPVTFELISKLMGAFMKPEDFLKMVIPSSLSTPVTPAPAVVAKPVETPLSSGRKWDKSRTIPELKELLIAEAEPEGTPDMAAVLAVMENGATKTAQAIDWAECVAFIQQKGLWGDMLKELYAKLGNSMQIWSDKKFYVEITNDIRGKLVQDWMAATLNVMGMEFILDTTTQLPSNLWTYADKVLAGIGEKDALTNKVLQDFKMLRTTPDHIYWLWKSGPKGEARDNYLAQSPMLFKALSKTGLKGNYLKSQRELRKLLLTDDKFLKAVMKNGDSTAAENLIICTRRQAVLEMREKQAILVKITRLYPQFTALVEGKARTEAPQPSADFPPHTSVRSYAMVQKELQTLISEKIPANLAALEEARSHGDLSENSEYKYAKEQQRFLGKRRGELDQILGTLQAFDFSTVTPREWVIPGSVVTLKYTGTGQEEIVTVLGLFDSDPDKNFVSYNSPLGKAILVKKLGSAVTLPNGQEAQIAKIAPLSRELLAYLNEKPQD